MCDMRTSNGARTEHRPHWHTHVSQSSYKSRCMSQCIQICTWATDLYAYSKPRYDLSQKPASGHTAFKNERVLRRHHGESLKQTYTFYLEPCKSGKRILTNHWCKYVHADMLHQSDDILLPQNHALQKSEHFDHNLPNDKNGRAAVIPLGEVNNNKKRILTTIDFRS